MTELGAEHYRKRQKLFLLSSQTCLHKPCTLSCKSTSAGREAALLCFPEGAAEVISWSQPCLAVRCRALSRQSVGLAYGRPVVRISHSPLRRPRRVIEGDAALRRCLLCKRPCSGSSGHQYLTVNGRRPFLGPAKASAFVVPLARPLCRPYRQRGRTRDASTTHLPTLREVSRSRAFTCRSVSHLGSFSGTRQTHVGWWTQSKHELGECCFSTTPRWAFFLRESPAEASLACDSLAKE